MCVFEYEYEYKKLLRIRVFVYVCIRVFVYLSCHHYNCQVLDGSLETSNQCQITKVFLTMTTFK